MKPNKSTDARSNGEGDAPAIRALAFRETFLLAITPADVRLIGAALLERAKAGDVAATRLVLDRLLGSTAIADWKSRAAVREKLQFEEIISTAARRSSEDF